MGGPVIIVDVRGLTVVRLDGIRSRGLRSTLYHQLLLDTRIGVEDTL